MKRTSLFLVVAVLAMFAANVAGAAGTPGVDRREARQRARIHQGWQSGELTRGERARLNAGQRRVHRMEWRAKRDGHVGPWERRHIQRAQDRQSRHIYRFKHNARGRAC
jgi:hypothetical protein